MEYYTLINHKYIKDIDSDIYLYSHNKTKAKVCVIKNDDNNKYFTIAFRTPPKDNTGVCHILEHSVLCGSNKYPIKDPYKELLKSSVNTFLNAMTYSDKTMYPCASTNDLDFKILMDVYLDAVFNPLIYKNKEIFEQEGYHYEVKENKIICNGVVYNEMQGVYSDPEQILYHEILKSLYPGSSYGFESGGYPKEIPNLSYEEFLDCHKNYYHPSNCYIYLYGNCDVEERLNYIALNYLNKFEYSNYNTEIKKSKCSEIKEVKAYYEVNDTNKNDTYLSYNLVLSSNKDMKLILAIDLILTILLQNPNAKITKKLVELGICKDINVTFDDQILTPFISIVAYGSNKDKEKEFVKLLNEELNYYAINGLDKELLRNQIEYNIFKNKEFNLSANKGLSYILGSLASLLYDNSDCYSHLEVLKYYEMLKEEINTTYFNEVIKDYLLNNNHKSYVSLEPKVKENKVHEFKNNLDKEELNLANLRLKEYQEKEDSEEVNVTTFEPISVEENKEDVTLDKEEKHENTTVKPLLSDMEEEDKPIKLDEINFDDLTIEKDLGELENIKNEFDSIKIPDVKEINTETKKEKVIERNETKPFKPGPQVFSSVFVKKEEPVIGETKEEIKPEEKKEEVSKTSLFSIQDDDEEAIELPPLKMPKKKEENKEEAKAFNFDDISGETYNIK